MENDNNVNFNEETELAIKKFNALVSTVDELRAEITEVRITADDAGESCDELDQLLDQYDLRSMDRSIDALEDRVSDLEESDETFDDLRDDIEKMDDTFTERLEAMESDVDTAVAAATDAFKTLQRLERGGFFVRLRWLFTGRA